VQRFHARLDNFHRDTRYIVDNDAPNIDEVSPVYRE
jgi:hypothetical protein